MTDMVNVNASWGRNPMPVMKDPQVNYLLLEATPTALARSMPLNFCFVLDHSGSMKGSKLANMKSATKRIIERLTPNDIVSLVIFDDTVQVVVPATPAVEKHVLLSRVDAIEECGGTAMSLGMQAGRQELLKYADNGYLSHMLLLTDGQTWGDEDTCRNIAESLGKDRIQVTALGLGSEWNEELLDHIADLTNGISDYIAEPTMIDQFFLRTLQHVQGTAAREVQLLLRLVRDVTPRAVHRITPSIANLGHEPIGPNELSLRMSDLVYGQQSGVLVELLIPPRAAGTFRIAQVEIQFVPVGANQKERVKQDVLLEVVADASKVKHHARVMNVAEKVTAFKLQTRALDEAEAGNLTDATRKLRAAATRLLDLGELELAEKLQEQATRLEQGVALSSEDQKALRYATRRLTQRLDS